MRPHVFLGGGLLLASAIAVKLFAPDAATPTDTLADRVGFPQDYRTTFQALRSSFKAQKNKVATTYANPAAASVSNLGQLPYPSGSVFVFEWSEPVRDANGAPVLEPDGQHQKGAVTRIDVMRREPGYGEGYGENRAGEWEFASYTPEGAPMAGAAELMQCAQCHSQAAARDFVFRGRLPPIAVPSQASAGP